MTVIANLATKVMDRRANYLVIIIIIIQLYDGICYYSSIALEILLILDDSTCESICDHHCVHQRSGSRCVCDRGYYLASDGITCIGKNKIGLKIFSCINNCIIHLWFSASKFRR